MKGRPRVKSHFDTGFDEGFDKGYDEGYKEGYQIGNDSYNQPFEGTSIVIASFNQKDLLRQCIESIQAHTPEAHEIIVVDNGSEDDTFPYLRSLGKQIRYKRNETNLGFAGGMNQGLRMARGSTILLLNNDTVVTDNWLRNMLVCLNSYPDGGLVGPMTNYISGEQLLETSYASLDEMHIFAKAHNVSDSGKWKVTERMTGFCVLMTRQTFERLGYFDEGFEIGNCEDDDYSLRVRLLGMQLVIAGDTFIHHVGSVSMKALGNQFDSVYGNNLTYYSQKWGDTNTLMVQAEPFISNGNGLPLRMIDYYPTHILVRGIGPAVYWIEDGIRHPVTGIAGNPCTRVPQTDLRNWPVGAELTAEAVEEKLTRMPLIPSGYGPIAEGLLLRGMDGTLYQNEKGTLRVIAGEQALESWCLIGRPIYPITDEVAALYKRGLPIIAPTVLRHPHL